MRAWLLLLTLIGPAIVSAKDEPVPRLEPGVFPTRGTERLVDGVLLEADFLHRSGQFRRVDDGTLVDFTLPPLGTILYLDAEADLRDVPLGTLLHFSTYPGDGDGPVPVALIRDSFSSIARDGLSYRLDAIHADEGKIVVSVQAPSGGPADPARREFRVDSHTRYWKKDRPATIHDLAVGDDLRLNLFEVGRCAELWAGVEARTLATDRQRSRHAAFIRAHGLAGWIERVEGKTLSVSLFGDPAGLHRLMKDEGIDPARWAAEGRRVDAVVANDELRTYNPPVDRKRAAVLKYEEIPPGSHGCGGVRWVIRPDLLLEGFRRGRVIRLFAHPSWRVEDMPFGETLYSEEPGFRPDAVDPNLYPYRTDSGNADLPWYRPRPGEFPPVHSHHEVVGELVRVDEGGRSGRFRADRTGELVDFSMPPYGAVMYLDSEADLRDVPAGTRCRFFLHQDDRGAFTRAAVISDEFTRLASGRLTYRIDSIGLDEGVLLLSRQHAPVKNEKEAMIRPPDFGREVFRIDDGTRAWKGDRPATLNDLAVGDELLLNTTGRTATSRGTCTEIWSGAEAHKLATDRRRAIHDDRLRGRGIPAWVDRVEGKRLTITFFSGSRRHFPALLGGDPAGGVVLARPADESLRPLEGAALKMSYLGHPPEADTAGTYGCSGVRWILETSESPEAFRPGRILLVLKAEWSSHRDK